MFKYSVFLMVVIGTSVPGFNAVAPTYRVASDPTEVTVVYETLPQVVMQPIILERCSLEDCSDTPQS